MTNVSFEELVHPRVLRHCRQLYIDGHFKHAALEAMTQVELALKEKSGVKGKYGVNLVTSLFGEGKNIKLRVPFGEELQVQAETFLKGAFSYYRNYCAHDGSKVDQVTCMRVMVLASELLDLVGASVLSFSDVGGIEGLVKAGVFANEAALRDLLLTLNGFTLPDEDYGCLEDCLDEHSYEENQVRAALDTDLLEYVSQAYSVPLEMESIRNTLPVTLGWFRLTKLGHEVVAGA